jgi:hypothetical protein
VHTFSDFGASAILWHHPNLADRWLAADRDPTDRFRPAGQQAEHASSAGETGVMSDDA